MDRNAREPEWPTTCIPIATTTTWRTPADANWLLVKVDDAGADARRNPVSTEPESVLSGRTVQDVMAGR